MRMPSLHRRRRAGNYSVMLALVLVTLLGFGALAIDVSRMRLAQAEAQDVADAASRAALIVLRNTGDQELARDAAELVVRQNSIAGEPGTLELIRFGSWDPDAADPELEADAVNPNGVHVVVGRREDHAVPTTLARLLGHEDFEVQAAATSATRSFQLVVVMDITNSWGERDFLHAQDAATITFEMLEHTASGVDEVGMTVFTNRFAWEYSPFFRIGDPAEADDVYDDWAGIMTASKAGRDKRHGDGRNCQLNGSGKRKKYDRNDFTKPDGGCYPHMPREYRDEPGTDHSAGLMLAKQMFDETTTYAAYRAVIVITDGRPNGLGKPGTARDEDGYVEERWREYRGPAPRSANDIRNASVEAAEQLWDEHRVHTWVVSFVADDWSMREMPQGDGYYVRTSRPEELKEILAQIVSEMPLALVE